MELNFCYCVQKLNILCTEVEYNVEHMKHITSQTNVTQKNFFNKLLTFKFQETYLGKSGLLKYHSYKCQGLTLVSIFLEPINFMPETMNNYPFKSEI